MGPANLSHFGSFTWIHRAVPETHGPSVALKRMKIWYPKELMIGHPQYPMMSHRNPLDISNPDAHRIPSLSHRNPSHLDISDALGESTSIPMKQVSQVHPGPYQILSSWFLTEKRQSIFGLPHHWGLNMFTCLKPVFFCTSHVLMISRIEPNDKMR